LFVNSLTREKIFNLTFNEKIQEFSKKDTALFAKRYRTFHEKIQHFLGKDTGLFSESYRSFLEKLPESFLKVTGVLTFAGNGLQIYLLFRKEIDRFIYYFSF
jgi:hypothetical protein